MKKLFKNKTFLAGLMGIALSMAINIAIMDHIHNSDADIVCTYPAPTQVEYSTDELIVIKAEKITLDDNAVTCSYCNKMHNLHAEEVCSAE